MGGQQKSIVLGMTLKLTAASTRMVPAKTATDDAVVLDHRNRNMVSFFGYGTQINNGHIFQTSKITVCGMPLFSEQRATLQTPYA